MKTLTQIVKEITSLQAVIDKDLSTVDRAARGGWEAAQNTARQSLEGLKTEFREALRFAMVPVYVRGDAAVAAQVAEKAKDLGDAIVVDADGLYKRIALPVDAMMGGTRLLTASQAARIVSELMQVGQELGIASMPMPEVGVLSGQLPVANFAGLVGIIRTSLRKALGDELNVMYIRDQVFKQALAVKYDRPILPVVILNMEGNEIEGGLGLVQYRIDAATGDDPEKLVLTVFNQINDNLKKTKTTKRTKNS